MRASESCQNGREVETQRAGPGRRAGPAVPLMLVSEQLSHTCLPVVYDSFCLTEVEVRNEHANPALE